MNEERMEQLARQLGARAAERLDVAKTARQVVERLREQPREAPRATWIQPAWLRIAAAVVIVVGSGALLRQVIPRGGAVAGQHGAHYVSDDLRDLSADELRDVLGSFDEILGSDSVADPDTTDWRGLDAQQLREVLRALEGEG